MIKHITPLFHFLTQNSSIYTARYIYIVNWSTLIHAWNNNPLQLVKSRGGSLIDEKIKGLQRKIYERPWCMAEEAPKIETHHTLPPTSIHLIKLLKIKTKHDKSYLVLVCFRFCNTYLRPKLSLTCKNLECLVTQQKKSRIDFGC